MLSAIALFLFSFAAEAKTKEVKSVKKLVVMTCLDNWMGDYNSLRSAGFSDAVAIREANRIYYACLGPVK